MIEQYDSDYLKKNFFSIGVNLNEQQISQFLLYYDTLIEWNSFMNLTTIIEYEDVVRKHFVDSVLLILELGPVFREYHLKLFFLI